MSSFGEFSHSVNWFGLVAGVFMLVFGILAPAWWRVTFGGEAVVMEYSPFNVSMTALGASMTSTLVSFVCIGARITISIAGVLAILGSLFTKQWWSRKLIKFGSLKLMWMIITLVVIAAIGPVVAGYLASQMASGVNLQLSLPTLSGGSTITAQMGPATLSAPITMELTGAFFFAIATAVLGIIARIYHRKLAPSKVVVKPVSERKVIKLKPSEGKKIIVRPAEEKKEKKIIKVKPK